MCQGGGHVWSENVRNPTCSKVQERGEVSSHQKQHKNFPTTRKNDLRERLNKALDWRTGEEQLGSTQRHHMQAFARTLRSAGAQYREEIERLRPIGFELYSISSTEKQLQRDKEDFRACEVHRILSPHSDSLNKKRSAELQRAVWKMNGCEIISAYARVTGIQNNRESALSAHPQICTNWTDKTRLKMRKGSPNLITLCKTTRVYPMQPLW